MIIATIRIFANSGNFNEIIDILSSVKGPAEGKSGCISCFIYQEVNHENRITYEEKWEKQVQLNKHICSDLYRKILAVIDMSSQPPEVKFSTTSSTVGMDLIKSAFGCCDNERNQPPPAEPVV